MSQFLLAERYCSTGHHDHLSPLGLQFCNLHEHCFSCNIKVAFHHEQYGILYSSHYRKLQCQHKDKKLIKQANKQKEFLTSVKWYSIKYYMYLYHSVDITVFHSSTLPYVIATFSAWKQAYKNHVHTHTYTHSDEHLDILHTHVHARMYSSTHAHTYAADIPHTLETFINHKKAK